MADANSKSAKKRAAKKARDAAFGGDAAEAPGPQVKAKGKAKVDAPAVVAKAVAKPKAEPKAELKPAAQPKADAKAKSKKKPVVEAAATPAAAPSTKKSDMDPNYQVEIDDGTGDAWATCSGATKKNDRKQKKKEEDEREKKEQEIAAAKAAKAALKAGGASEATAATIKTDSTQRLSATQLAIAKARELANAPVTVQSIKKPEDPEEEKKVLATAVISVPENKIGRVIGPKGKNLALIKEKTGITNIDTDQGEFTVSGEDPKGVALAEVAIREMVEKGYMSLAYDDFMQVEVMAHPSTFPDLIGKGGEIIRKLKEKLEVEVTIPQVPKGSTAAKKFPVGIAGAKVNVEKAQECIESITTHYHHDLTHEGKDHVEMEVPDHAYAFVIGKQGSELRHIQNNWDVKVYIPREHSANANVVIVGHKDDCEKSKQYIEKLVSNAQEKSSDKRQDKADDHRGEDVEEPWMKPYMAPKRR